MNIPIKNLYVDKVVLIGSEADEKRLAEKFGKDYVIRDLVEEGTKLEAKKLTEIK